MSQLAPKSPSVEALAGMRHLEQASQALMITSPALSAFLGSQRAVLASTLKITDRDDEDLKRCRACSYSLIPGWSCQTSRISRSNPNKSHPRNGRKQSNGRSSNSDMMQMIYKCSRCQSETKVNVTSQKPKAARSKLKMPAAEETAQVPLPNLESATSVRPPATKMAITSKEADKPAADASVKKRPRKTKHGGLQALLAKTKNESSSPAGFDLMDFMKSG
ncbi:hypothetical protein MBLNU459_g1880t1 [Dothideomycetes sp. NU459]